MTSGPRFSPGQIVRVRSRSHPRNVLGFGVVQHIQEDFTGGCNYMVTGHRGPYPERCLDETTP